MQLHFTTRDTKVCSEIEKTEKKIADLQDQLSELNEKKTELENLEIINTVRAMVMDKDQVMAFLASMKSGKAPQQPSAPTITKPEVSEND